MSCAPPGSDKCCAEHMCVWVEQLASLPLACNRLPDVQLACAASQAHCLHNNLVELLVAIAVLPQSNTAQPHQQLVSIVQPHHVHLTENQIKRRKLTEFLVECSTLTHSCASHASVRAHCVCTMHWNSGPAPSPAILIGHLSGLADGAVLLCRMAPAHATEHSQHPQKCTVVHLLFTRNSVRQQL